MGAYRETLKYWVYNQYKIDSQFFLGGKPQYILPPLNVCFTCYLQSCHHPLPHHQYTGYTSGPYQSKTATSGPALHIIYRYMQTHAKVKDDCEDEFHLRSQSHAGMQKILGAWSPVYMQTHAQAHTRTETQTHGWKLIEVAEP